MDESELMIEQVPQTGLQPALHLMLIDADPVFRLGLRVWLQQFPDLKIVAEANNPAIVLTILAGSGAEPDNLEPKEPLPILEDEPSSPEIESTQVDLIILDLDFGDPNQNQGLLLCQSLKAEYPRLPILLLTSQQEISLLVTAWQLGVEGYCLKGIEVAELVQFIRQVAAGQKAWQPTVLALIQAKLENGQTSQSTARLQPQPSGIIANLRSQLRETGMQEMAASLAVLQAQLEIPTLSWWQRAFLEGQQREILAAQWFVNRLLASPAVPIREAEQRPSLQIPQLNQPTDQPVLTPINSALLSLAAEPEGSETKFRALKSLLFESTLAKLTNSLQNQTGEPLEVDILRSEKKRELLYLVLRKLEEILDELRFSQVQSPQLAEKRSLILQDLWQTATSDFFGKYYTLQLANYLQSRRVQDVEVVSVLLQDQSVVTAEILDKIPLIVEFLEHLLFQFPLVVDNCAYPVGAPEAVLQASALLENLLLQVANGVIQPLLNHFADVEIIKQNFYDRRLISAREIERFRNSLTWKYRLRRLITEPKDIFESQFSLFIFSDRGIKKTAIYAPRSQELKQLSGLQLAVTLALETRDAVAPPLQSTVSFLGRGLIYLLTQVIGRGIGLIGRGVIQGIGSSWQDIRFNRKSPQQK